MTNPELFFRLCQNFSSVGNKYWLVAVLVAWGKYGWLSSIRRTTCLPLKCCPVYAHTDTGKDRQTQTQLHHLPTPQEHTGTHKYIHKHTGTTCLVPTPQALPCVRTQTQAKTHKYIHGSPAYLSRAYRNRERHRNTITYTNTCYTCLPLKHSSKVHRQIHRQTQTHLPIAGKQKQARGERE